MSIPAKLDIVIILLLLFAFPCLVVRLWPAGAKHHQNQNE